ncbi:MAG: SoxR reducing system RseC family protein [Desulfobacterales bacterium]|nr:SoxR reducing system RseC family protein [Desulfobacterales bacterium]
MTEQIGIIRENHSEGWAIVVTDRKGACEGCHPGGGCHACLSGAKLESRAANPIKAQAGDVVKISLPTSDLLKGAFILYLMPVAFLIVAALLGERFAGWAGLSETTGAVLTGVVGLASGVGLVMFLDRTRYVRQHMIPTITAVMTPALGQPATKQPSCCR